MSPPAILLNMLLSSIEIMMMIWDSTLIHKGMISLKSISSLAQVLNRSTHNHKLYTSKTTSTQLRKNLTTQMRIQRKPMTTMTNSMSNPITLNSVISKPVQTSWYLTATKRWHDLSHQLTKTIKVKICSSLAVIGRQSEQQKELRILQTSVKQSSLEERKVTSLILMKHLALKISKVPLKLWKLKVAREKPS